MGRNIRDALKSIFRNFGLSMASIFSITITLLLVAISIVMSASVDHFTKLIKQDFTIVVFIENRLNQEETNQLESEIKKIDNIERIKFESKQEISKTMMESSDVFKNIMGRWNEKENPIQNTFLVKVEDTNLISKTAKKIENLDGVSNVKYGEGMVESMLSIFKVIEKALILIVISLIVVTAFLIANTIKLTIFARKREVEIMRLVGASNINIEISFIIEGLFLGLLGSLTPVIILIYGYSTIYKKFNGALFSPFIRLIHPEPFVYYVALSLVGLGVLVGMFGSLRAVRKHLKI